MVIIYSPAEVVNLCYIMKVLGFLIYGRQKDPKLGRLGCHCQWRQGAWRLASLSFMGPWYLTMLNPF